MCERESEREREREGLTEEMKEVSSEVNSPTQSLYTSCEGVRLVRYVTWVKFVQFEIGVEWRPDSPGMGDWDPARIQSCV